MFHLWKCNQTLVPFNSHKCILNKMFNEFLKIQAKS